MSALPIGMLLMQWGVLTNQQVEEVLARQPGTGWAFGKLAHEIFGVSEHDIFNAWVEQEGRACSRVDLACEPNDPSVLRLISGDEAMDKHVLPLRVEGGELVCATTVFELPEAARLLKERTEYSLRFVVTDRATLERYILRRYAVVISPA